MTDTYQPSGDVDPASVSWLWLACGAALVLGIVYQFVLEQLVVPELGRARLVPFIFGLIAVASLTKMALRRGAVRNTAISVLAGLAIGALAVIGSHAAAVAFRTSEFVQFSWLENYGYAAMWEAATDVESYIDVITDVPPGEVPRWLYWMVEAGAFLFVATFTGWSTASRPFCEGCSEWLDAYEEELRVFPEAGFEEQLGDAPSLRDLCPPPAAAAPGELGTRTPLVYRVAECPSCQETRYLNVFWEDSYEDEHEVDHRREDFLIEGVAITPSQYEQITDWS